MLSQPSLREGVLTSYLSNLERRRALGDLSRMTVYGYRSVATRFLTRYASMSLETITPEHIETFLLELRTRQGQPLTHRSHHQNLLYLRRLFTWAIDQRLVRENPCDRVIRPKWLARLREFVMPEEFDRLLAACETLHQRALLVGFYDTGLRLEEFRQINVGAVDWDDRSVTLIGKGGKERYVPFSARVTAVWADLATGRRPEQPLFWPGPGYEARRMSRHWIEATLRRLGERAGLRYPLTAHLLRHGWFYRLKVLEAPTEAISRMGGHSSTQITENLYGRLKRRDLRRLYDQYLGA